MISEDDEELEISEIDTSIIQEPQSLEEDVDDGIQVNIHPGLCEYASICSQSNYGNSDQCHFAKDQCRTYWDNRETEMKMWVWYTTL